MRPSRSKMAGCQRRKAWDIRTASDWSLLSTLQSFSVSPSLVKREVRSPVTESSTVRYRMVVLKNTQNRASVLAPHSTGHIQHWAHSCAGVGICPTVMDRATGPTTETHLGKLHQETKEHGMDHWVDQLTIEQGSFERPVAWPSSYSWSYASWPLPTQSH